MAEAVDLPTFAYVECDGMVYLVERAGRLAFPSPGELPFEAELRDEMTFPEARVLFFVPKLAKWPRDWTFKDAIPALPNVEPIVQRAVNMSLVREVSGAVILDEADRMLMVKAARGFTKGMWNIPGGFVTYGETPEESVVREVEEEVGLAIRVVELLGVYSARFASPYYMRGHMFLAAPLSRELKLSEDEIAHAEWLPLEEAHDATLNPFCKRAIEAWWKKGKPPPQTKR